MKKWISILSALLIIQLAVAAAVNVWVEDYGAFESQEKLLALDGKSVDGLLIQDGENSLSLSRQDDKWLLPDRGNFPADQQAVKGLLEKLSSLEKGWPVATTGGAAKRFKVDEEDFERKLTLRSGEEDLAELYVGTSPGFRKVHVRPAGQDSIYAVPFNVWEANATVDDWIDKQVLELDSGEVTRVEMPGLVLQRDGDAIQVVGLEEDEESNGAKVTELVRSLAGLQVQSLLGKEPKPKFRRDTPDMELKVSLKDGDELTYRFYKPDEGTSYVLKRSDLDFFLGISEYAAKPILEAKREQLVTKKADAASDAEAGEEKPVASTKTGEEKKPVASTEADEEEQAASTKTGEEKKPVAREAGEEKKPVASTKTGEEKKPVASTEAGEEEQAASTETGEEKPAASTETGEGVSLEKE